MGERLKAGNLRNRITIETPTPARDGYGQDTPTWSTLATLWADIRSLSGRQLALAQGNTITSTANHSITIRWFAVVPGKHRIKFMQGGATRYFSINSASDPDQQRRQLDLMVTEVVG